MLRPYTCTLFEALKKKRFLAESHKIKMWKWELTPPGVLKRLGGKNDKKKKKIPAEVIVRKTNNGVCTQ